MAVRLGGPLNLLVLFCWQNSWQNKTVKGQSSASELFWKRLDCHKMHQLQHGLTTVEPNRWWWQEDQPRVPFKSSGVDSSSPGSLLLIMQKSQHRSFEHFTSWHICNVLLWGLLQQLFGLRRPTWLSIEWVLHPTPLLCSWPVATSLTISKVAFCGDAAGTLCDTRCARSADSFHRFY